MNQAIAQVDADHVLLLNNDITVITGEWIEALVEQSQRPEVGAVGCRLLYPGGGVQHDGIAVSMGCTAINLDLSFVGYLASAIREVTAVTGACMMVRRAVYEELGGLDERLRVAFNDVDLCLRLWQRGYKVMFTPIAELQHRESASRGRLHPDEDALRFVTRWGHHSRLKDPFMNPNIKSLAPYALRLD
jgi:GT2 family glycosyltransferase